MKKYLEAESVRLVFSGNNYFELLEEIIDKSKEILHLQTYIFETDATGRRIVEALKRAAARKVKVFVLVDAFGSSSFSKAVATDMIKSNIRFRKFSPLFSSESIYFGRRLHYKLVVVDKNVSLTGGINIADKYNEGSGKDPWLDYAILTKGQVCEYLHVLCEKMFHKRSARELKTWEKSVDPSPAKKELIRFRLNDFIKGKNEVHQSYTDEILAAKKSMTIVASYFLPGHGLRKLLASASARGVKVRIILAGKSDVDSVRLAENYLYNFLLKNNIELYEWRNSVLHGKAMVADDKWATIGSYNLNFLSHYISIELNADIMDPVFIRTFSTHLDYIIETSCNVIDLKSHGKKVDPLSKFMMWLAYIFFRTLMNLTVNKKRRKSIRNRWIH